MRAPCGTRSGLGQHRNEAACGCVSSKHPPPPPLSVARERGELNGAPGPERNGVNEEWSGMERGTAGGGSGRLGLDEAVIVILGMR